MPEPDAFDRLEIEAVMAAIPSAIKDACRTYNAGFPGGGHERLWSLNLVSFIGEGMCRIVREADRLGIQEGSDA